jgi:membrane protease YdiL (CAAX protease family)
LAGFIILGGLSFALKDDKRKLVLHLLLVFSTLFAAGQIYTSLEARKAAGNEVFVEADKAEMALRMTSALMALEPILKSRGDNKQVVEMQQKFYLEADKALDKALKIAPDSSILLTKRLILHNETGRPIKADVAAINKIDTEKAKNLSKLVTSIFITQKISKEELPEIRRILKTEMTGGWYQDVLAVQIERVSGTKKSYEKKVDEFVEHYKFYLIRIAALWAGIGLSGFVGVIIILAQLFMLGRTPTSEEERAYIAAPVDWGWKVVYGVFIAWLSTEFLVVPLMKGVSKDLANIAVSHGAVVVALITAGLYLSQNLPAIFYIWFFAVRNHSVKFAEAVRFRWKTKRRGPIGLFFAGVATWYAAIPLVIASTLVSSHFGSQGSSNPIVAVVLSSVKESNPLAVVLFLITLGVLPALCEETLFRGFLYTSLRRKFGVFISIVFSATLFSLAHFDVGGALQLFVLGALFAFVFERTKSLIPAMVAHCMWNSGTFLMALTMLG